MTLPSSGALSLNSIQGEFGGSNPIGLNEYYRGGSLVPNHSNTSSIPTSGTIDVQDFYGTSATSPVDLVHTFTMSGLTDVAQGKFIYRYIGYATSSSFAGGAVGSASDTSVASGGTSGTIIASAQQQQSGWPSNADPVLSFAWRIQFSSSAMRDAIFSSRSGANFQGLGNENWSTATTINGNPWNPAVGNGATIIVWGVGVGGTNATEVARYKRFAEWADNRTGSSTTVTFY
tara:strand:- start:29213 stop:29908 length:696 start_codon:yes stop_codon:yes gene_type:complete